METGCSLDHNPRLARILSIPSRRTRGVPTKRDVLAIRQFPSVPNVEQTGASSGDGVTRQRAPVGDPLNDEQWSDHLSNPSSHKATGQEMVVMEKHEPEPLRGLGRRYPQRSLR